MFDIQRFGQADVPVVCGSAGDVVTPGINLKPNAQFGSLGIMVELSGAIDGNFDIVIETAVSDAAAGVADSWYATDSRLNGLYQLGIYSIPASDPVVDKVRARIIKNGGTIDTTFAITWIANKAMIPN